MIVFSLYIFGLASLTISGAENVCERLTKVDLNCEHPPKFVRLDARQNKAIIRYSSFSNLQDAFS